MLFRFCALTLAAALLLPAAPASAHPFGPPSTALISADGSRVALSWRAAEDDWVALGQSLGAFEDPAAGPVSTELTGEQKLGRSPAVRDYLLDRIALSQHGRPCPGQIAPLENLLAEGARLTFDCPAPVTEVEVTLKTLTDLNTAYRTVLTAETPAVPAQALFTAAKSTQRLRFTEPAAGPPATALPIAGAALGGLAVLVWRRRTRAAR